jgi:glycosyltransferase involved in cell wall biosynthesis
LTLNEFSKRVPFLWRSIQFPMVSIVTVYYNRADMVSRTVESILAQTYSDWELIFVDDGSTDDTQSRVQPYVQANPRIRYVYGPNSGFTKSIRKGVALSSGSLVAICGSGDIQKPERLAKQVNYLKLHPDCGVVGAHSFHRNEVLGFQFTYRPAASNDLVSQDVLTHGEVMFRRDIYNKVGGYREFFTFAQDRDLWFRMGSITRIGVVPEVLVETFAHKRSVTGQLPRHLEQLYYSDLAEQCHLCRCRNEPDLVEGHGNVAWLYREPSGRLARKLMALSKLYMLDGNWAGAHAAARRSARECLLLTNVVALLGIPLITKLRVGPLATSALLSRERALTNRT